jgi:uncharacterized Zn-finger protein
VFLYKNNENFVVLLKFKIYKYNIININNMEEHKCNVCDKLYTSPSSLWAHNKKYHNTKDNKYKPVNKKGNIQCQYCDKQFGNFSNRGKHHKICKLNPTNINHDIQKPDITMEIIKTIVPEIVKSLNLSQ